MLAVVADDPILAAGVRSRAPALRSAAAARLGGFLPQQLVASQPTTRRAECAADRRSSARIPNGCINDCPVAAPQPPSASTPFSHVLSGCEQLASSRSGEESHATAVNTFA